MSMRKKISIMADRLGYGLGRAAMVRQRLLAARRRRLCVEGLEDRRMLAITLTSTNFELLKDINTLPPTEGSNPAGFVSVGSTVFFTAGDTTHGRELWKSDGTEAGTVLVKDISAGSYSSYPSYLTNVNGTLYFGAYDGTNDLELWKSDGTEAGTVLVKDIREGSNNSYLRYLTNVNGTLYFRATDGTNGHELWKSDGTAAGTVLVKDIFAGDASSYPTLLTNVDGTLYFSANDGTSGLELWKSDGTAAGTVLVKDIREASGSSGPRNLANVNGTLCFFVFDGTNGRELWKSDGTASGTVLVKDIFAGDASSYPALLTNVNGTLYFSANDGTSGAELWMSDGTAAGTVLVKDIRAGSSNPMYLTNVNGTLYFRAFNENGHELWKSDGTASGTVLVKDILAGSSGSNPSNLTNVNGTLYFTANDGTSGYELWKSDGTAAGTVLVKDLTGDSGSSNPTGLTVVGDILYAAATTEAVGTELFMLNVGNNNSNATLVENNLVNAVIGTLATTDPDVGDTFTYRLISGTGSTDNTAFTIDGIQLKAYASFDFETKASYSIRVRTTDAGGLFVEQTVTISVTDINEAPTTLTLDNTSIAENTALGTNIGTLSTTDPDAGDAFSYTLVAGTGGADNGSFRITGNQLKIAASPDFETKPSYMIRVQSTDAGGLLIERTFTISVANVNEAPSAILLSASTITENVAIGTPVGMLSTIDPDANDSFSYTLAAGSGDSDNAGFTIAGNQLRLGFVPDFETRSSYSVRVRSTDTGGLFTEQSFNITISDVIETKFYQGTAGNDAFIVGVGTTSVSIRMNNVLIDTLPFGFAIMMDGLGGTDSIVVQDNTGLGNTIQLSNATFAMGANVVGQRGIECRRWLCRQRHVRRDRSSGADRVARWK